MALYTAQQVNASKRQKTALRDLSVRANVTVETNEYFAGFPKIEYKPDATVDETLCYRFYNASEKIHGRTMEEWLRAAVSFLHAFHSYSDSGTGRFDSTVLNNFSRSWDEGTISLESYKRRLRAAFEFYSKIGVKYWTVYDRDLAPEGDTIEETNQNLDEMIEFVLELQQRTNIKPLWVAANFHSHSRYYNGACTSSEPHIISCAGAQLKKAMEIAQRLGADCFLFRGTREGYSSTLNTDHSKQLRNYARLLKMTAGYKERLGYRGQLLFEPNFEDFHSTCINVQNYDFDYNKTYYRYDYDTTSAICFLKHYNLDKLEFKISTKPGHQLVMASAYGMLGSVDCTSITSPPKIREATLLMKAVVEHGGLQPGGLNIGLVLRPDSTELKDLLVAYINCIDIYAKGFRIAAKLIADSTFAKNLQQRYLGFHSGFGSRFVNGEASLEECEEQAKKLNQNTESVQQTSGRSEHWEAVFTRYCNSVRF
ncbi:xylose isomerase-like [Lycorma delicatula]|uniref:xylose isomerase-like n=1 Tax=Lycorma delicatula TaxID=130591 RepID=UPI003F510C4B